jgi:hypothetical protein
MKKKDAGKRLRQEIAQEQARQRDRKINDIAEAYKSNKDNFYKIIRSHRGASMEPTDEHNYCRWTLLQRRHTSGCMKTPL